MKHAIAAALALLVVVSGCAPATDELVPADKPAVAFKGEADKKFVGVWKSTTVDSTYKLSADGAYQLHSRVKMPGGPGMIDADSAGEWRLDGDKLLFKDAQGNVVPYEYKLDGDNLSLISTGKMKNKTELKKQAEAGQATGDQPKETPPKG